MSLAPLPPLSHENVGPIAQAGLVPAWNQARDRERFIAALVHHWPQAPGAETLRFGLMPLGTGAWVVSLRCDNPDYDPSAYQHTATTRGQLTAAMERTAKALEAHLQGWSEDRAQPLMVFDDLNFFGNPPERTSQEWQLWAVDQRAPALKAWLEARQLESVLPPSPAAPPRPRV